MITDITATTAEAEDYTGEDGLLYCGKCHTPKEAYFAEGKTCFGRDRHPAECDCQRAAREKQQAAESRQKHLEKVEDLKRRGFTDPALLDLGLKGMVGKGARNKEVIDAIVRNGCVYFVAIGGAAALIAKSIKKEEMLCYEDLGTEAVRRYTVEDFPCIVAIDSKGNNVYETEPKKYNTEA